MATTGKPGEIVRCNTCGASAAVAKNGFIRAHQDARGTKDENGNVKMCYG